MMNGVVCDDAGGFVGVVAASVQVAGEAGKIAAGDFDPDSVAGTEIIAGRHRRKIYFVNLAGFQHRLLVRVLDRAAGRTHIVRLLPYQLARQQLAILREASHEVDAAAR